MKLKNIFGIGLIIVLGVVALFYFLQPKNEPEVIKIGAILPLTGPAASFGKSSQNAMDLALKEINLENTIIDVEYEDGKGDPTSSINALNKLYTINDVRIFTTFTSRVAMSLAPIAEQKDIILFANASHPNITENKNHILRFSNTANDEVETLLKFLEKNNNFKRLFIIALNDDYGRAYVNQFEKQIENFKDIELMGVEFYGNEVNNFKPLIAKVINKKIDIILIIGFGQPTGLCIRQLKEMNYKNKFIVSLGFILSNDAMKTAGKGLDGNYYINFDFTKDSLTGKFFNAYVSKYKEEPAPNAYVDYLTIYLIYEVYKKVGPNPQKIRDYIIKQKNIDIGFYKYEIKNNGDIKIPVMVKEFPSSGEPTLWDLNNQSYNR